MTDLEKIFIDVVRNVTYTFDGPIKKDYCIEFFGDDLGPKVYKQYKEIKLRMKNNEQCEDF